MTIYEQLALQQPYSFMARCITLPNLFAGKMHALVYRAWQRRVKGRSNDYFLQLADRIVFKE